MIAEARIAAYEARLFHVKHWEISAGVRNGGKFRPYFRRPAGPIYCLGMPDSFILWRHVGTDKTHASGTFGPRTLCGRPIEGEAWERMSVRDVDESAVECRRCRQVIEKLEREMYAR